MADICDHYRPGPTCRIPPDRADILASTLPEHCMRITPVRSTGMYAVSPSARALTGRAPGRLSPSFLLGIVASRRIMPMLCHRQNSQRPEIPTRNHAGVWRSPFYTTDRLDAVLHRWGGGVVGASHCAQGPPSGHTFT